MQGELLSKTHGLTALHAVMRACGFHTKIKNNDKGQGNHCSGGKASAFREHVNGHQELCADYSRI